MSASSDILLHARDPRLAPLAFSATAAWLWSADGARVIWSNAAGAAALGAASPATLSRRRLEHQHPTPIEIVRLLASLPPSGAAQLARLRGLTPNLGRLLTCACSHFRSMHGEACMLIVAAESIKPTLSLAERARRMFDGVGGVLVFSSDGNLLSADTTVAGVELPDHGTLAVLGAEQLAAEALAAGSAAGPVLGTTMTLEKLGGDDAVVLVATFEPTPIPTLAADREGAALPPSVALPPDATGATLDEAEARLIARRQPLRFVWTIDGEARFTIEGGEFTTLMGDPTASRQSPTWTQLATELNLDPGQQVERAIASQATWSDITIAWPADASSERLPVLLSGFPVLDREGNFGGYRGFGVCRDIGRIAAVIATRRAAIKQIETRPTELATPETPVSPTVAETRDNENKSADRPAAAFLPDGPSDALVAPFDQRPPLTLVPMARNVVPFRVGGQTEKRPALNMVERNAFQEIARALGARLEAEEPLATIEMAQQAGATFSDALESGPSDVDFGAVGGSDPTTPELAGPGPIAPDEVPGAQTGSARTPSPESAQQDANAAAPIVAAAADIPERVVLDRLPIGVVVTRGDALICVNRTVLEWTGFESLDALALAGGLERLFSGAVPIERPEASGASRALALRTADGGISPVDARLSSITWNGAAALMLVLTRISDEERQKAELALRNAQAEVEDLRSILDTATDGILVVDQAGMVLSVNRSAEALFGYASHELVNQSFLTLFAPESHRDAVDYLDGLTRSGVASLLNDGREIIGRVRQGGLVPLFMTMGRMTEAPPKFCAVLRDITQWKRTEEELTNAKRQAEKASMAKSEFLATISHEIRTPLNAIIGFSEVMMEQRFGPIGNERYRDYANDIRTSGEHMISLLNDLLDLSKIEAGKLELTFAKIDLNDVMQQCVAIMQPQANRDRIIIRTALSSALPPVIADMRSVRQIVLNLLSNSIKFTGAGGQVIVSTALTDAGEPVLRVRDTGVGMSEQDLETALEPFRQLPAAARLGATGSGLGLPLTKALAEANRAAFRIKSAVNAGTLVEIIFPAARVPAE